MKKEIGIVIVKVKCYLRFQKKNVVPCEILIVFFFLTIKTTLLYKIPKPRSKKSKERGRGCKKRWSDLPLATEQPVAEERPFARVPPQMRAQMRRLAVHLVAARDVAHMLLLAVYQAAGRRRIALVSCGKVKEF